MLCKLLFCPKHVDELIDDKVCAGCTILGMRKPIPRAALLTRTFALSSCARRRNSVEGQTTLQRRPSTIGVPLSWHTPTQMLIIRLSHMAPTWKLLCQCIALDLHCSMAMIVIQGVVCSAYVAEDVHAPTVRDVPTDFEALPKVMATGAIDTVAVLPSVQLPFLAMKNIYDDTKSQDWIGSIVVGDTCIHASWEKESIEISLSVFAQTIHATNRYNQW